MTEEQINELERLAAQATPGPWEMVDARAFLDDEDFEIRNSGHCIGYGTSEKDAAYVVAACNAVPELIKMYREAEDKANNAWRILLEAQGRIVEVQKRVRELERMTDIMAEELSSVEIAPSICHGCKEQDMFGMYSCGGKDCIYSMVKQAAKEAGE